MASEIRGNVGSVRERIAESKPSAVYQKVEEVPGFPENPPLPFRQHIDNYIGAVFWGSTGRFLGRLIVNKFLRRYHERIPIDMLKPTKTGARIANPTRVCTVFLILIAGTTAIVGRGASSSEVQINKVSFLIHPVCWDLALDSAGHPSRSYISLISSIRGGAWYDVREFLDILAWERRVNEKQKEYIRNMGPDEALIIYPIGNRKAMIDLENFGEQQLGRRCIIIHSQLPTRKDDSRQFLPESVKPELMDELVNAGQKIGYDWSAGALKVILYNRKIAIEIQQEFHQRGLRFDPATVKMVAFGEGFEQCAMTWKAMLPYYLDLRAPIENDYQLSVSGMPLLRSAVFKERIALQGDVRLFLWQLADGRPMGLLTRAMARLSDPQLFGTVSIDARKLQIFSEDGEQFWPRAREADSGVSTRFGTSMRVPIYAAVRQFATDKAYYIVGDDITYDQFRRALVSSVIASDK